ncbi:MAG: Hsp20/alpha crystallin family protein [Burkholderiales bacterium]|nr:Hsp20/alpha crystallin family protein [Burkholderiales bacterium]
MHSSRPFMFARRAPYALALGAVLDALNRPAGRDGTAVRARPIPCEVAERDDAYVVTADLPGYRKEDITVEVEGARVTITAESGSAPAPDGSSRLLWSERAGGRVRRAFEFGDDVDQARAAVRYADGVLTLTLPKKVSAARKLLPVE